MWEKQKRGLAHVHGVIAVGTPAERAWAKAYVTALRDMAPRYGFGFVDGWHKVGRKFWPGEQAGAYLSSDFVAGRGHEAPITENVAAGDLPRLVVFVGRDLTKRTGCTMKTLRIRRRLWALGYEGVGGGPRIEEEDLSPPVSRGASIAARGP